MPHRDLLIYVVHAAAFGAFVLTRVLLRLLDRAKADVPARGTVAQKERTAPFSRMLLMIHMLAFGVMYYAIGLYAIPGRVPEWFPGQRVVGAIIIASGGSLMVWALIYFRSWRIRAKLDRGHELATGGPFRFIRNPIYMGMNLFALGTAVWIPTALEWVAFALMVLGSDLRARAEAKLLKAAFGEAYSSYCQRTWRFVPGIY